MKKKEGKGREEREGKEKGWERGREGGREGWMAEGKILPSICPALITAVESI